MIDHTKTRQKRKILFCASEAVPFIKTGGLADVCGALPKILKKLGHDVRIVLPRYWAVNIAKYDLRWELAPMGVQMGNALIWCAVLRGYLEDVPVYFIEHEGFFGRAGIYDDGYNAFLDNPARFGFFSRACIQLCKDTGFRPDIIHCNDWPTALIPAYVKTWDCDKEFFKNTATILSIHNIGYQGKFPADSVPFLGLGPALFNESTFECHGGINLLKGGVFFADAITTVSPNHANELCCPIGSNGLAAFITRRRDDLAGILNGADYDVWDPDHDPLIPQNYHIFDLTGKQACKETIQRQYHLDVNPNIPIIAILSRLSHQKGLDLIMPIITNIVHTMRVQFIIVGRGEKHIEDFFGGLPASHSGTIGAWIGYTEMKAHLLQAGADFLLMPSLYEPCGLNQIYSLCYGTIPIVRSIGGLRDTVINYCEQDSSGTGFTFQDAHPDALYNTIGWAIHTYHCRPEHIQHMRHTGMAHRFTWVDAALQYEKVYTKALSRRESWVC